ncbi:hypothetical protein ABE613_02730 [Dorea sp. YH-dor228]
MPKNNKGERNKRGSGTRMKREYVKPVIESEEFVANEYVAACWIVSCYYHHTSWQTCAYEDWTISGYDNLDNYITVNGNTAEIHKGSQSHWGEDSNKYYHNTNVSRYHHELTVVPTDKTNNKEHPNVSG